MRKNKFSLISTKDVKSWEIIGRAELMIEGTISEKS